jgi:hypothetical protein
LSEVKRAKLSLADGINPNTISLSARFRIDSREAPWTAAAAVAAFLFPRKL